MTDDQIRDLVMVSIFFVVIVIVFGGLYIRLYRYYKLQGLDRFDQFLQSLGKDRKEYQFFTTGHAQVWCETSEKEIKGWIANQCVRAMGAPFPVPSPPRYIMHVNEDRNAIYIVFADKRNFTFDWDSLVHYEDWIGDGVSKDG